MKLNRIARKYVHIPLTVTLADGSPAPISGADLALVPPGSSLTAQTVWVPSEWADGRASVLVAGPEADPEDALVIPVEGVDVWARITDSPEVDVAKVGRISVG